MSVPVPAAVEPRWSWQRGGALRQRVPSLGLLERAGLVLLVVFTLLAIIGPLIVPYDPEQRVAESYLAPSAAHLFGTDDIGRDEFSRVIVGIRLTWIPGLAIIASGVVFGGLLGLLAGAYGGWTDRIISRFTDLFLVLPSTLIAIAVVAALGPEPAQHRDRDLDLLVAVVLAHRARRGQGDRGAAATSTPRGSRACPRPGSCSGTCCRARCRRSWSRPRSTWPT